MLHDPLTASQSPSEPAPAAVEESVAEAVPAAPEPSDGLSAALTPVECQGPETKSDPPVEPVPAQPVFRVVGANPIAVQPTPPPDTRIEVLSSAIINFLNNLKPGMEIVIRVPA